MVRYTNNLWCPSALVSQLSTAGPAVLTISRLKLAHNWSPLRSLRKRQSTATLNWVECCTEKVPALYQTLFFLSDHQRKKRQSGYTRLGDSSRLYLIG